jgi:hypothetical protein
MRVMIMIDDAIRFSKRHGWAGAREGDRMMLRKIDGTDTASLLVDEHEGRVTVARLELERIVCK